MIASSRLLHRISHEIPRIHHHRQSLKVTIQNVDRKFFSSTNWLNFKLTSTQLEKKNVIVPQLAESLSEGDIRFEKNVGDIVSEDDLIASIETDKTSVPVNSPVAGKIVELLVEDSSTVKPGQSIIVIDTDAKSDVAAKKPQVQQTVQETKEASPSPPQSTSAPISESQPMQVTPAFTKPLSQTPVSKVKSDLDAMSKVHMSEHQSNSPQGSRTETRIKMNRMRQKIASRLKDAQNTYAMLTTFNEIDMSNLIEMRQKYKEAFLKKHQVKLGFMSAFVKASQFALKDQPVVNATIEGNEIIYRDYVDISVAVATPKGLVVPVLRNVERMNYADIEKTIVQLGEKAKNNALTVGDMEGGTFTISNGGVFGSLFGTPIINSPQSAILGMHATNDRPVALNGQVVIRPVMVVALTYDHRLIDGREAVTFLKKIKEVIEDPRVLLLDL